MILNQRRRVWRDVSHDLPRVVHRAGQRRLVVREELRLLQDALFELLGESPGGLRVSAARLHLSGVLVPRLLLVRLLRGAYGVDGVLPPQLLTLELPAELDVVHARLGELLFASLELFLADGEVDLNLLRGPLQRREFSLDPPEPTFAREQVRPERLEVLRVLLVRGGDASHLRETSLQVSLQHVAFLPHDVQLPLQRRHLRRLGPLLPLAKLRRLLDGGGRFRGRGAHALPRPVRLGHVPLNVGERHGVLLPEV